MPYQAVLFIVVGAVFLNYGFYRLLPAPEFLPARMVAGLLFGTILGTLAAKFWPR